MYFLQRFARHASSVEVSADAIRPSGEFRKARWADIDLPGAEWRFTTSKTGTSHIVPLATQAKEILEDLQPLTRRSEFVFPG